MCSFMQYKICMWQIYKTTCSCNGGAVLQRWKNTFPAISCSCWSKHGCLRSFKICSSGKNSTFVSKLSYTKTGPTIKGWWSLLYAPPPILHAYTVKPVLRWHPQEPCKRPLNAGCPLNTGSNKLWINSYWPFISPPLFTCMHTWHALSLVYHKPFTTGRSGKNH